MQKKKASKLSELRRSGQLSKDLDESIAESVSRTEERQVIDGAVNSINRIADELAACYRMTSELRRSGTVEANV
jgi:hypothetical protein